MSTKKKLLLVPEMVPSPLWGRSAFRMLGRRATWTKRIRPDALADANSRCVLCGAEDDRLICHDKWLYDDRALTATLVGFDIHCWACDRVTHIGQAMRVADPHEVLLAALNHLCSVNQCTPKIAEKTLKDAMDIWTRRSKKEWTINVAAPLVVRYPELAALPEFIPPGIDY